MKEKKLELYSIQSENDDDRRELFQHILERICKVTDTSKKIEVISNRNVISIWRRD